MNSGQAGSQDPLETASVRLAPAHANDFADNWPGSVTSSAAHSFATAEGASCPKEAQARGNNEVGELWHLKQQNAALQAAYTTQSQQMTELEEERNMLQHRVNELEAGIADDEAELEIAVQEMDMQMMAMEQRATAAEEALRRERQVHHQHLAAQAMEAADLEFERKFGLSPASSTSPAAPAAPPPPAHLAEDVHLRARITELETLLKEAYSSTRPPQNAATPSASNGVGLESSLPGPLSSGSSAGSALAAASTPSATPPAVSTPTSADPPPGAEGTSDVVSPSRGKMSTVFEGLRARHKEKASVAAARLARAVSQRAARRERSLSSQAHATSHDHSLSSFDKDLAQAVAVAALSAVGAKPDAFDPIAIQAEQPQDKPKPMRPYTEQSVAILKMELLKRGVLDISDCKVKSDLVNRLSNLPPEAFS